MSTPLILELRESARPAVVEISRCHLTVGQIEFNIALCAVQNAEYCLQRILFLLRKVRKTSFQIFGIVGRNELP